MRPTSHRTIRPATMRATTTRTAAGLCKKAPREAIWTSIIANARKTTAGKASAHRVTGSRRQAGTKPVRPYPSHMSPSATATAASPASTGPEGGPTSGLRELRPSPPNLGGEDTRFPRSDEAAGEATLAAPPLDFRAGAEGPGHRGRRLHRLGAGASARRARIRDSRIRQPLDRKHRQSRGDRGRARRGRRAGRRRAHARGRAVRGRLPPRRRHGRRPVDRGSVRRLRPERARDALGALGCPQGRRGASGLFLVQRSARCRRLPGERGQADGAAFALRGQQGDRRGVLLGVPRRVRVRRDRRALLERLRTALGAQVQRDPALHPAPARRRGARRVRRRHADARLRLRHRPR